MLQFITNTNRHNSIVEQAEAVIKGGCRWIQLSGSESGESLKETATRLIPLCTENDVFLTLDHDVELVNELKIHGIHLTPGDMLPAEAREFLGPHAVIGVSVTTAAEVIALKKADIDYVQIGPYPEITVEQYKKIVDEVRDAEVTIPIVATGQIGVNDLQLLMSSGISGVAMSTSITDAPDMSSYTKKCLEILTSQR